MNNHQRVFLIALLTAAVVSAAACYPLVNVLVGNPDGWFTMENIDEYGDDLDARATVHGGELVVFTGHPSYVIASDEARLLFDMPRNHYYATTFNNTTVGDRFYHNLTTALRSGQADVTIAGPMTETILKQNQTAETAFVQHYCRVPDPQAQALYNTTNAILYQYNADCPVDRRPDDESMSPAS